MMNTSQNIMIIVSFPRVLSADFRPLYRTAGDLRAITNKPCMLLTATCTARTKTDILSAVSLSTTDIKETSRLPDR